MTDELTAAVERTLQGAFAVVVEADMSALSEHDSPLIARWTGLADFPRDRCAMRGDDDWTSIGAADAWSAAHPRWALEALRQAITGAALLPNGDYEVTFDHAALQRITDPGLTPDSTFTAQVRLDAGGTVAVVAVSEVAEANPLSVRFEFEPRSNVPAID